MISSDHDNLDTSGSTLGDSIRHSSSGRINHGHESNKSESLQGEVDILSIEWVSSRVLVSRQHVVTESQDSLSRTSQVHVGRVESVLPLLSHGQLSSVNDNGGASVQDPLRSTLHHQQVSVVVLVLGLVDGHLELVSGVEGDLANLLVGSSVGHDISLGQLSTLEDGNLGSITIDLSLEDGDTILTSL